IHRLFHHRVEVGLALLAGGFLGAGRAHLGHLHADRCGEILHRVDVTQPGVRHEEADRIAVRGAAEAVVELLGGTGCERRRLLAVEWAQPKVVGAALLELDVARHYLHDVDPVEEVLLERVGDHDPDFDLKLQPESLLLTRFETLPMSARPARRALSAAITFPMSFMPEAPDSATAAATASPRSLRAAFSNWAIDSRRCLISFSTADTTSASESSIRSSTSLCFSAASSRRMADRRAASLARIAAFMSSVICCLREMLASRASAAASGCADACGGALRRRRACVCARRSAVRSTRGRAAR